MENTDIQQIVEKYFEESGWIECYYVNCKISGKKVEVFIDRDGGISFDYCQKVSRYLESIFDEELPFGEDYTLDVSSPGVGSPLKLPRQYINNIGRTIEVITDSEKFKGILTEADDVKIKVTYEEKIKEGKKNIKMQIEKSVMYTEILEAKIKIVF